MLGACEAKEGSAGRCNHRPENKHPSATKILDDYAVQLAGMLQAGVDKVLSDLKIERHRTWHVAVSSPTKKSKVMQRRCDAIGDLGKIRPILEAHKSSTKPKLRTVSPTSVVPLQDFSWAAAPLPELVERNGHMSAANVGKIKKRCTCESGRLMELRWRALSHPSGPLLLEYARDGCSVDIGRPWTKEEIMAAAERGPHKYALAEDAITMMHKEVEEKIRDVYE